MKLTAYELWDDFKSHIESANVFDLTVKEDVEIMSCADVVKYMLAKYGSWKYVSGFDTVDSAFNEFMEMWRIYKSNYRENWGRMYDALVAEYNPIENFDRKESVTITESGSDLKTLTETGNDLVTNTNNTTNTTEYVGTEDVTTTHTALNTDTVEKTGEDTTTDSVTVNSSTTKDNQTSVDSVRAFNSYDFSDANKHTENGGETNASDTQETHTTEYDTTEERTIDVSESDTNTKTFNGRQDLNNTSTDFTGDSDHELSRDETTTYGHTESTDSHLHGNIGITTNQQMINEELRLRMYSLAYNIIEKFITDNTVLY